MNITEVTNFPGLLIIEPTIYHDNRGLFYELHNLKHYDQPGIPRFYVQDNLSISKKYTVRGMHYQVAPYEQAKLVTVLQGEVLDTVIDLRNWSPSFGKTYQLTLSDENHFQLYIPWGFAHGFSVLSETATFYYKCDNYYNKEAERNIYPFDPLYNISWGFPEEQAIISEKDKVSNVNLNI